MDVAFIDFEDDPPDLSVSFAIGLGDWEIESLILSRTPTFEWMLPAEERGVAVCFDEDGSELVLPRLTKFSFANARAEVVSSRRTFDLDLRRVDPDELEQAFAVLRKMNFDNRFALILPSPGGDKG